MKNMLLLILIQNYTISFLSFLMFYHILIIWNTSVVFCVYIRVFVYKIFKKERKKGEKKERTEGEISDVFFLVSLKKEKIKEENKRKCGVVKSVIVTTSWLEN